MQPIRIHALFEYGFDLKPFGSSQIRILRPYSHPTLKNDIRLTSGHEYFGENVDAIILDRLWRQDISMTFARSLLNDIRRAKIPFIYAIDDNLLELRSEILDWDITSEKEKVVEFFLEEADGVIVTTERLQQKFSPYNTKILVVPNALDENLIFPARFKSPDNNKKEVSGSNQYSDLITIGYMGTFTHDSDLLFILPALENIIDKYKGHVKLQLLGGVGRTNIVNELDRIGCERIRLSPQNMEYTKFLPWFTSTINWDISISPLRDTPFTRGKSDIKFLDYCAIGSAGVFSNVEAYSQSVENLMTGILVNNTPDEWYSAIEILIEDIKLRQKIRSNAWNYLITSRILSKCAPVFSDAIKNIIN
ncbi:MAG: glycosyltransferase family 1 protein [Nitrosopumilales archaeon]|nr:MAG: glycosyltransferase family 1 protein [Nitrosopumilales archaeon]